MKGLTSTLTSEKFTNAHLVKGSHSYSSQLGDLFQNLREKTQNY